METAVRSMKANFKLAGQPCGWCAELVELGEDVRVCGSCEAIHHAPCWDKSGGCSTGGCVNVPFRQLEPKPAAAAGVRPGETICPTCGKATSAAFGLCSFCNGVLSPVGIFRGPQINAPGAVSSLVLGIVGILVCGVILGPLAISRSRQATYAIKSNPRYTGGGMATAGLVLGIIDIVFSVLYWIGVLTMAAKRH